MTTAKVIIDTETGTVLNYDTCVVVDLGELTPNEMTLWEEWESSGNDTDAIRIGQSAGKELR